MSSLRCWQFLKPDQSDFSYTLETAGLSGWDSNKELDSAVTQITAVEGVVFVIVLHPLKSLEVWEISFFYSPSPNLVPYR